MKVTERDTGDVVVLTLQGRLILEEVDDPLRGILDDLLQRGRIKLVLNLQQVTYIDSAGLGFLVSKYVSAHRRGGDVKLVHVTPRVARVLDITRLSRVFQSFESEDDAVRAFTPVTGAERLVSSRS